MSINGSWSERTALFFVLVPLVLLASGRESPAQVPASSVPVEVVNPLPFARVQEPVASGLAVPEWVGLLDPSEIMLFDAQGAPVPLQLEALSRWHGERDDPRKACKWVLAMFLADVPASGTSRYYFYVGGGPRGLVTHVDRPAEIEVDTGPAKFIIDKNACSLFRRVEVGAGVVTGGPGEVRLQQPDGTYAAVNVLSTSVEKAGDVRTVVKQRAHLPALDLHVTIRYYFWSGRPEARIDFRLENNGAYGAVSGTGPIPATAYIQDLALRFRLGSSIDRLRTAESSHASPDDYELAQDFVTPTVPLDMTSGFTWQESTASGPVGSGGRHSGTLGISGPAGAMAVAVDRFWQNFPKAFRADDDFMEVALFPRFGAGPPYGGPFGVPGSGSPDPMSLVSFRFEGGRWKTHTMVLAFREHGSFTSAELDRLGQAASAPLMARPVDPGAMFAGFPFGQLVVERRDWTNTSQLRYERQMDVLACDQAADDQPTLGRIGFPAFRRRGGTYGGQQMYGWENYGDIAWADGYCSLHYDMPWGVLINWHRTGRYEFFDVGRDMAAHRRDYDQNHSRDTADPSRGGQFYEKGYWHGNFRHPTPSHTWVHGLLLHYVTTGDEGSREAALEVGDFIRRRHPEQWDGFWGSRILGWQLEGLVDLYNYVGDDQYLQLAQATAARWAALEQQNGSLGYVINPGAHPPEAQTWMQMIVFNALAKYHYASGDASVVPVMERMADFYVQECIHRLPAGAPASATVGSVWGTIEPGGIRSDPSVHHGWVTVEALANAAVVSWQSRYVNVAWRMWESLTRFHQASPGSDPHDYLDPASYSPIAFRMLNFPNSESKIMSNIARWGHAFLALSDYISAY